MTTDDIRRKISYISDRLKCLREQISSSKYPAADVVFELITAREHADEAAELLTDDQSVKEILAEINELLVMCGKPQNASSHESISK